MKTHRGLYAHLIERDALEHAFRQTVRRKRRRPDVAWMTLNRIEVLSALRRALTAEAWRPRGFDLMRIRDPKPRIIARAPIVDRVVHNAIVLSLDEVWAPRLIDTDFACRRGYGTHRAVLALQRGMRRHRFALHLDVRAYFPSIDPSYLLRLLARHVRDTRWLRLVETVLDAGRGVYRDPVLRRFAGLQPDWPAPGRGLPIGAATSQYFAAHVYLNGLDHWVKRSLKVPTWCRYMDDMFVFGQTRQQMRTWRAAIGDWLGRERDLRLKHPQARIIACAGRLNALGYAITRTDRTALTRARRRLTARVRAGVDDPDALRRSIDASLGVLQF